MESFPSGHTTHSHRRTSSLGSISDHASKENGIEGGTDEWQDRPPVPTLLGYEVMEERAKFTVRMELISLAIALELCVYVSRRAVMGKQSTLELDQSHVTVHFSHHRTYCCVLCGTY